MTIRPSRQPALLRSDSCSSAEINTHLLTKPHALPMPTITPVRRVNFNNQVMVRTIGHVNDLSEAEIRRTWYQKEEYRQIRSSLSVTVRKITSGKYDGDTDSHCARGLEFRTPYGAQLRRKNKLDALIAVLDEQDRQMDDNDLDDEALARLYTQFSFARLYEAQRRGELDELEALAIHEGVEILSISTLRDDDYVGMRLEEEKQKERKTVRKRIGNIFGKVDRSKNAS
ncbi:hypothetical protein MHU86_26015 [Fragilaria crotonensis]|nr:hypothetical protein MHU86_26015 [Fragilaria crotonensis]